ncbi:MAG: peroxidase family protein [Sulfitobacter sp.]
MTAMNHGLSRLDNLFKVCLKDEGPNGPPLPRSFGRLLPANPVHLQNLSHAELIEIYDDLVEEMRATANKDGSADAGMTFLGQFVDHDITMDATSALGKKIDPSTIPNVRTPALDLDCVYGAGPDATPHLYGKEDTSEYLLFGRNDNPLDLARTSVGTALIGDPRNDENVIVSQIQGAFICLHNILMDKVASGDMSATVQQCAQMGVDPKAWARYVPEHLRSFEEVRRFIRLHYQWIIWHELLPAFCDQACLDAAMGTDPFGHDAPVMPVEFSGAAYRFGHATTQAKYHLREGEAQLGLFATAGFGPRPESANLAFDQFFAIHGSTPQKSRPVGTALGGPLFEMPFVKEGMHLEDINHDLTLAQSKKLALRNIIRDRYTYQLASGQSMARHLGLSPRHPPEHLKKKGISKTPLWFYCLEEADDAHGKLAGVGGTIVASVFARLLRLDSNSFVHAHGFQPWNGFGGEDTVLGGLLKFVEKNRDSVTHAEHLRCG